METGKDVVVLNSELLVVVFNILDSLETDTLTDESYAKLGALFPETLVVAALDLVDRGNVLKLIFPWNKNKTEYQVLGTTATYLVHLDLPAEIPFYCSCPAFSYSVLSTGTHIMCKHLLATLIARHLDACVERPITADELVESLTKEFQ
ncbi:hypothetical protein CC1G_04492 [Coprinopsis cinerea okayama7|uniref:SWIM-type domain-containing protein n=1 Tax=Coprinopsis cinerea (strain Okayama-7 / 130 / ATCC MYA-4618 / FGSC 9003) TaxID=240176 RepID=A8N5B4_COPC7|nr:hypothetical protein CC1G_04492 [Coprinopsis cinerea okayama7\|eukprot:XP_001830059.1 hypothetical protein CC1G_04492 [Coprinopsis cinerea okayama7\